MYPVSPVISLAILLAAALVGGMIAHRLRQPVMLGYLVIGVAIGPHALGFVDDLMLIEATATIGVALLMFTLGLEISIDQLRQVGKVGLWGGLTQIVATCALGLLIGSTLLKWPLPQAILFGLVISLSSTAVCFKTLMERGELSSVHGRIMIAILVLQDISVVLMMVALPLMEGRAEGLLLAVAIAVGEAILFTGIAIVSGMWVLPWLMGRIGGLRSRELFLLTILVLCLGTALGTQILGLSMVFGAFLVGLVLRQSRFVHQALAEITPLRDIFATLFFVSLGMLLSPAFVLDNWSSVLLLVLIIIVIKLLVVFAAVRLFGYSSRIALLTGAGLFQIGEFSFIMAQAGIDMGIISERFYSLILASAIVTMLLTPLSITLASKAYSRLRVRLGKELAVEGTADAHKQAETPNRVVVAGYGRVGQNVARGLQDAGLPYLVIDIDPERIHEAREHGVPRVYGDASNPQVLSYVDLGNARTLVVTYPDPLAVIATVKAAREFNPKLHIVARVHRSREADELKKMGVADLINPEYEASLEFMRRVLSASGWRQARIRETLPAIEKDEDFLEFNPD
jgi:CPA2 family monovalent cation:H+ antiporter-2